VNFGTQFLRVWGFPFQVVELTYGGLRDETSKRNTLEAYAFHQCQWFTGKRLSSDRDLGRDLDDRRPYKPQPNEDEATEFGKEVDLCGISSVGMLFRSMIECVTVSFGV